MVGLTKFFGRSELFRKVLISPLYCFFSGVNTFYLMSFSSTFGDLIDTGSNFWVDL